MTRRAAPGRSAGFMLVEVMVALSIAALVFVFAFEALSGAFERLRKDEKSVKALLLAQSTLDRIGQDIELGAPASSGDTNDGFTWQVLSSSYAGDATAATGPLIGYVVRVTVAWKERRSTRQVQLTTVKLAHRERAS